MQSQQSKDRDGTSSVNECDRVNRRKGPNIQVLKDLLGEP